MRKLITLFLLILYTNCLAMGPKINLEKAVDNAIKRYRKKVEPRLIDYFSQSKISYPPKEIALLAFKSEKIIELWAKDEVHSWTHIHNYPLTAYSGHLGPKLTENDLQIPEGIYKLVNFNPFSSYHLSMMINYPNQFDKQKGVKERRRKLGNNIFLHGRNLSVGCLAVGNRAIEQLFTLARRVGLENIKLIIAPNDMRIKKSITPAKGQPKWLPELYRNIKLALKPFKATH